MTDLNFFAFLLVAADLRLLLGVADVFLFLEGVDSSAVVTENAVILFTTLMMRFVLLRFGFKAEVLLRF